MKDTVNLKNIENLQNDNVFVKSEIKNLSVLTGLGTRKGLEQVLVCENEIVNVVSEKYGHLPNEVFFREVETKLNESGLKYAKRSINRDNRSFAVDYILNDETMQVTVKNGLDVIKPMLRFVNSYDGSNKTSGHFGMFRQVCTNGLHVADMTIGFSAKHKGNIVDVVMPEVRNLVSKFMENEYYSINKKFEVLAERPITDLTGFVKLVADKTKLFKFESSEKNPEPSLNARTVIETVKRESQLLGTEPTLWLGYNALNELLHGKMRKTFEQQKTIDAKIFEAVMEMAN